MNEKEWSDSKSKAPGISTSKMPIMIAKICRYERRDEYWKMCSLHWSSDWRTLAHTYGMEYLPKPVFNLLDVCEALTPHP